MAVHSPEQLDKEERRYIQVFFWLALLTGVELAVIVPNIPQLAKGGMLVAVYELI